MLANRITQAIEIIQHGGIIVYSTDTILGLGCDPNNKEAVEKIIWLKRRDPDKGLILLVKNIEEALKYSKPLTSQQLEKIHTQSPKKPTTWLLPVNDETPCWIKGKYNRIAMRITQHNIAKKLCSSIGAIVSTSANLSNYPTIKTQHHVRSWFGPYIDYVIIGAVGTGQPSEIYDLVSNKIVR